VPTPSMPTTVDDALAARDQLVETVAAGGNVKPLDFAAATGAVQLAEAHQTFQARQIAAAAEATRVARVREIHDSLVAGDLQHQADEIVAAYDTAVAALTELRRRVDERHQALYAAALELARLGPADDVALQLHTAQSLPGGIRARARVERNNIALIIDGRRVVSRDRHADEILGWAARDVAAHRHLVADAATTSSRSNPADQHRAKGTTDDADLEP
jgi:hypothetical protein